jgi:hypothetical protein
MFNNAGRSSLGYSVLYGISFFSFVILINRLAPAEENHEIDFGRDVRPILSNHCFQCHGSDEATREADLRLDDRDVAVELGAITPGKPDASELLNRIISHDDLEVMPPAEANKPLTQKQIETLKQWIAEGANYNSHWAFERVEKPEVPATPDHDWSINEIDSFVLRKLHQQKLKPSPRASKEILIRRLYQDVLGLLPTPEEVETFVNDTSPHAYSDLVDQLLASPHYGERWGRHWLDQARYADSHGYTIDGSRIMWPYRDWVIAAINEDLPFDQFTIEQLAGDLLPDATKDQLVATAFHRNTMINQEGGVKADQYRNEALIDRTNTTGAVWLGLTVGCAQCHTHKFDPITHDEYYSMYAFFNDAADANNTGPTVDVYQQEMLDWKKNWTEQLQELKTLRGELPTLEKRLKENGNLTGIDWKWISPDIKEAKPVSGELSPQADGSLLATGDLNPRETYSVTFDLSEDEQIQSRNLTAVRLRVLTDESLPKNGPGAASNGNFVLSKIELHIDGKQQVLGGSWADHSQPDYDVSKANDGKANTGWAINVNGTQAKAGKKMNAPHEAIFTLLKPASLKGKPTRIVMKHEVNENYNIGRFAIDFSDTPIPTEKDQTIIKQELAQVKQRIKELESSLPGSGKSVKQMIVKAQAKVPETYRLIRGDFLDPDKEHGALDVTVPAALITTSESPQFQNRLDLAKWIVSRENPLTARVTVNRVWAKYFGRGLVETENDFGFQGTTPTHPELLDWLAANFMENGWSMKSLHRLILNSATYQQSSDFTPELLAKDPGNYLLARQSRFRVEAEIVRDQALAASGLLTSKVGGPSVYPPQPDGIYNFTQNKKSWPTETGPNRYRRTMYTMFYRSAPYPLLSTFDAPDFSTTCTRRVRSNTPLQSLTMANDIVFQEFAIGLAKRVINEHSNVEDEELIKQMFKHALTRNPREQELAVLQEFYNRESERFHSDPKAASEFISEKVEGTDQLKLAALSSLARVLMNTDEFMTRN